MPDNMGGHGYLHASFSHNVPHVARAAPNSPLSSCDRLFCILEDVVAPQPHGQRAYPSGYRQPFQRSLPVLRTSFSSTGST